MNLLPFMLLLEELFFLFAQLHFLLVFSLALDMRRCRQERQILSFSNCVEWVGIHWRCIFETFILCVQTFSFFPRLLTKANERRIIWIFHIKFYKLLKSCVSFGRNLPLLINSVSSSKGAFFMCFINLRIIKLDVYL